MTGPKTEKIFLDWNLNETKLKLIQYLLSERIVDNKTGCWFTKNVKDKNKRPNGFFNGINATLARFSAAAFLEFDIDNDLKLEIRHKQDCFFKACFNPDHIYISNKKKKLKLVNQ